MKNTLRIISLILLIALTCSLFAACSNEAEESSEAVESSEAKPTFYGYEIPEGVDYGGRTISVLTTYVSNTATCYQIKPESNPDYSLESASAVTAASSECTKLVEELLNIEIEEEVIFSSSRFGGPMYQRISRDAMSYTADYVFAMPCLNEAAMLATDGVLYDLNGIVNLDNAWWCKPFNDTVTIAGKTYFASGDIGTVGMESTMFVAFNKRIESANGLARSYGYETLYDMVDAKAWTQDVMFEMSKTIYVDSNENNKPDPEDIIGVSGQENFVYWLLRAGDIQICSLDSDGYPVLSVNNERALNLISRAQEYCQDNTTGFIIADDYLSLGLPINPAFQVFLDGRGLFFFNALSSLNTMRTMEDDFGVLPCPLFDSTQENYNSNVGSWTSNCVCVPTSVSQEDLELVGHLLEALGAVSKSKLTPTYYEQTLQYQISRDDDSMRMLDIINANRAPELAEMYRWGNMMATVAAMRIQPVGTFVSAYERVKDLTEQAIEDTVETFKANNN
ncbi:MAG: hypothetical protein IKM32_00480 [Clostridia bacterium]|nr:hypothetical protein [Clostridia bacterium]